MKGDRPMARTVFVKIALVALACLVPVVTRPAEHPLSKDDVTLLLIGGATPEKMITLIQERGIDFQMNPDLAKKFHDEGAEDRVIEALTRAGEKLRAGASATASLPAGAASSPPPSSTAGQAQQAAESSRPASSSVERKIAEVLAAPAPVASEGPLAPAFSLVDLSGKKLDLADYKGKVVLLDFWATWCQPCRSEIPEFMRLQKRYSEQGFQVIGISLDDSPRPVRKFYQDYNMNYPVAMVNARVRQLYDGVSGVPTTFLIGRDGRVYDQVVGAPVDITFFSAEIRRLLGASPPGTTAGEQIANARPVASGAPSQAADSKPTASGGTPIASLAPPAAPKSKPAKEVDLSDPTPDQIQHIIREFAAKERVFREARDNYTYHQINKVEELDADGNVAGRYEQDWDILYDDSGKRIEQVTYAPPDTLKGLIVTQEDLNSMRNIQPFVLTTEELPEYDVTYLGHVKVDEITAYVFRIRPKEIIKGHQYFQGVVWVDDRDLQIVKSEGKPVPELRAHKGQFNLFPRFTTYREQIDGKFWFPTFTMADDTLYFPGQPVHMKEVIRYTDYKQYRATSTIRVVKEITADQPKGPSKGESPKNSPPQH